MVWTRYGPPEGLQLQEVPQPAPKDHEVLVRIRATTVTAGDCEIRRLKLPFGFALPIRLYAGIFRPIRIPILGQELAGDIEAVGKDVRQFQVGDAVFAWAGIGLGTYAQYRCMPEEPGIMGVMGPKPANISYEEAAAVPLGGLETLGFLKLDPIQPGQTLLINGAGGSIGTLALQLAKHRGAEVTAVDSTGKLEMLRSIGADHTVDFTREDSSRPGGYDSIWDVAGKGSFSRSMRALKPHGRLLMGNAGISHRLRGRWATRTGGKRVIATTGSYRRQDLLTLKELIEAGVIKPVIDRRYPLEQMAEAHRYVESGQKKGNVAITVG